jgi:hypothetical protein
MYLIRAVVASLNNAHDIQDCHISLFILTILLLFSHLPTYYYYRLSASVHSAVLRAISAFLSITNNLQVFR